VNFFKKILPAFFLLFSILSIAQTAETISLETKTINLPYGLVRKIPSTEPINRSGAKWWWRKRAFTNRGIKSS